MQAARAVRISLPLDLVPEHGWRASSRIGATRSSSVEHGRSRGRRGPWGNDPRWAARKDVCPCPEARNFAPMRPILLLLARSGLPARGSLDTRRAHVVDIPQGALRRLRRRREQAPAISRPRNLTWTDSTKLNLHHPTSWSDLHDRKHEIRRRCLRARAALSARVWMLAVRQGGAGFRGQCPSFQGRDDPAHALVLLWAARGGRYGRWCGPGRASHPRGPRDPAGELSPRRSSAAARLQYGVCFGQKPKGRGLRRGLDCALALAARRPPELRALTGQADKVGSAHHEGPCSKSPSILTSGPSGASAT